MCGLLGVQQATQVGDVQIGPMSVVHLGACLIDPRNFQKDRFRRAIHCCCGDEEGVVYFDSKNLEEAQKALRIQALSPGWRGAFEERLTKEGIPIEDTEEPRQEDDCCGPGV